MRFNATVSKDKISVVKSKACQASKGMSGHKKRVEAESHLAIARVKLATARVRQRVNFVPDSMMKSEMDSSS